MLTEVLLEGPGYINRASFIRVPKTVALSDWHLSCQLLLWNLPRPTQTGHAACLPASP